jgi:hypothetical protein
LLSNSTSNAICSAALGASDDYREGVRCVHGQAAAEFHRSLNRLAGDAAGGAPGATVAVIGAGTMGIGHTRRCAALYGHRVRCTTRALALRRRGEEGDSRSARRPCRKGQA